MNPRKKSTHGGARPNSGGARKGAGRPASGKPHGKQLPYRVPAEVYTETIERVHAYALASGRSPGQVIADAVGMLPVR